MTISEIMRIGFVVAGVFIIIRVFGLYAKKRLTVDIAMAWEAAGVGMAMVGIVSPFSGWCELLSEGTAIAIFLCGIVVIWAGLRFSILLSGLQMKIQELAVQVSLLKEENRGLSAAIKNAQTDDGEASYEYGR